MTQSRAEQFFEIAESAGGRLTDESAETIETLLTGLRGGESADWSTAAHFLLGLHYSNQFWNGGFPTKHDLSSEEQIAASKVIGHLTIFLQASPRPCFVLCIEGEEIELPALGKNLWAAFGVDMPTARFESSDPRIPLCGETTDEIDLTGIAMDRLALVYYLSGDPKQSADTLYTAIKSPSADWWWDRSGADLTRFYGWIGWLYFDAQEFSKAAIYLQRCFDDLDEQPDEGSSPVTVAFIRLVEMYMYGGNDGVEWRHAIADAGNVDAYGDFVPSGTLNQGCDAFMLRLAISHAACGDYKKAMKAADLCVRFGEPLEDLQFEVYENFQPVPFPEARLIRAALSLILDEEHSPFHDLATCLQSSEEVRNEVVVLACLCILRSSLPGSSDRTMFTRLAEKVPSLPDDKKTLLEHRCEAVLSELLNGSQVSNGFRCEAAGSIANEIGI